MKEGRNIQRQEYGFVEILKGKKKKQRGLKQWKESKEGRIDIRCNDTKLKLKRAGDEEGMRHGNGVDG